MTEDRTLGFAGGFPWAFAVTVAVIIAVEVFFRLADPSLTIAYGTRGRMDYYSTRNHLDVYGPAEISVVGSSRARESLLMPLIARECSAFLDREVSVANYSCGGVRASQTYFLVNHIARLSPEPPGPGEVKLLVFGVGPEQLISRSAYTVNGAILWDFSDWWRAFRDPWPEPNLPAAQQNQKSVLSVLPIVVHSYIGDAYKTFKYRDLPGAIIADAGWAFSRRNRHEFSWRRVLSGRAFPSPMRGGPTRWQAFNAHKTLADMENAQERLDVFIRRELLKWEDPDENPHPQTEGWLIERAIERARQAGWTVVLFEVPLSRIMIEALPEGVPAEARTIVEDIASEEDVPFFTCAELGVDLTDEDFLEPSHLNRQGAERFTRILVESAILPQLRDAATPEP